MNSEAESLTVHSAIFHSRSEACACRTYSNVGVSSIAIFVVVAWVMEATSRRVLFTVSTLS